MVKEANLIKLYLLFILFFCIVYLQIIGIKVSINNARWLIHSLLCGSVLSPGGHRYAGIAGTIGLRSRSANWSGCDTFALIGP
jgi:hypothetical protein